MWNDFFLKKTQSKTSSLYGYHCNRWKKWREKNSRKRQIIAQRIFWILNRIYSVYWSELSFAGAWNLCYIAHFNYSHFFKIVVTTSSTFYLHCIQIIRFLTSNHFNKKKINSRESNKRQIPSIFFFIHTQSIHKQFQTK